jgi:uncharacterized cupredoxin-like copper-binding protein
MSRIKGMMFATVALISGVGAASAWAEGATVAVSLWDKGAAAEEMLSMMAEMPMTMGMGPQGGGDMAMAPMGVRLDVSEVPAGEVTLRVTNDSAMMIHEMLVIPIASTDVTLPYDAEAMRIDEEAAQYLGEVSELDPGGSGALTLTLEPGLYMLACNIPGHYGLGMWTVLTVKG